MSQKQSQSSEDPLTFTLTRELVQEQEQALFEKDLNQLGLDATVWVVLNGTASSGTKDSIPKVLRAYRGNLLRGVAYIMECRRSTQAMFDRGLMGWFAKFSSMPMFYWSRNDVLIDAHANPGFVTEGLARDDFVKQAIGYLQRKYLFGLVNEPLDGKRSPASHAVPFCDAGIIDLETITDVDMLFARSKSLKRKTNKFCNKGGSIEVIQDRLSLQLTQEVLRCLSTLEIRLNAPFQDNYANMVKQACALDCPNIIHFIVRLQEEVVGYHSFARSGDGLYCLSGAFDRTRKTNYHAYENMILESIRFGLAEGLTMIHYGPVLNPTKAKMMVGYERSELRYQARFAALGSLLPLLVKYSQKNPGQFLEFIDIGEMKSAVA